MTRAPLHPAPPPQERGFTLIEMLVALAIFAMVSAAGVLMLRSSLDAQASVSKRLADTSGLMRLRAMLAGELMAAQPRPVRDTGGAMQPAVAANGTSMSVTYAGDGTPGGVGRATYRLDGSNLVRTGGLHADGAPEGPPAILMRDVAALTWRYRGLDGTWAEGWAPDRPDRLPRAVEMTVTRTNNPPVTMAFVVGPDGLPPPGADEPTPANDIQPGNTPPNNAPDGNLRGRDD
jgi:general secretion pathway protein J